jgi:8-oxo-dGTP pyrophosphatase MutT (NUDIX family)
MASDWQILSTQTAYQNSWIELRHHQVINPSGGEGIYGMVHFKNIAAAILPLDTQGFTYLVGQYRFPLNEYSWELPMGGVPLGNDLLAGAQRELLEETGLVAQKWTEIAKIHTSNCVTDEVGYVFLAEELSQKQAQPEATENLTVRKLPFEEVYQMALNGLITDSISVAAILKLAIIKKIA